MFDISTIAAKDEYTIELLNAQDDPLIDEAGKPLSITVYGPGSREYTRAQAARSQRMIDRMAKKGKIKVTAEVEVRENAEFLAACTKSFNGFAYHGKEGADAILDAYMDRSLGFIADQVAKAIGDWSNFSTGALKN